MPATRCDRQRVSRRRLPARFLAPLAALACLPLAPLAGGGETADERAQVARRIRSSVESFQQLSADRLAERAAFRGETARLEGRIRSLTERRDAIETENRTLRSNRDDLTGKLRAAREETGRGGRLLAEWAAAVSPVAERMAGRIRAGIPHERSERAAELAAIARILRGEERESHARTLRRFWVAAGRELQLAGTRELRSSKVDIGDGSSKHAYVVRLGLVNELCFAEDGTSVGIAARRADEEWRFLEDPEELRRARTAFACIRQRQPPRIAPLPFLLEAGGK